MFGSDVAFLKLLTDGTLEYSHVRSKNLQFIIYEILFLRHHLKTFERVSVIGLAVCIAHVRTHNARTSYEQRYVRVQIRTYIIYVTYVRTYECAARVRTNARAQRRHIRKNQAARYV